MTKHLVVGLLAVVATAPALHASAPERTHQFQSATIVSVHRQEVEPTYSGGDNPTDAPLRSEVFAYDVSVHAGCSNYVAHYESPYDYLPDALAPNHRMAVRVGIHTMDFDLGYRRIQMDIVHRKTDQNSNCSEAQHRR